MGVLTQPFRKTRRARRCFACPDLMTFCGLDGPGLVVSGQRLEPDRAVLRVGWSRPTRVIGGAVGRRALEPFGLLRAENSTAAAACAWMSARTVVRAQRRRYAAWIVTTRGRGMVSY